MTHTDRPAAGYTPPAITARQTVVGLLGEVTSSDPIVCAFFQK
jgi:hypothetical protein